MSTSLIEETEFKKIDFSKTPPSKDEYKTALLHIVYFQTPMYQILFFRNVNLSGAISAWR